MITPAKCADMKKPDAASHARRRINTHSHEINTAGSTRYYYYYYYETYS